MQRVTRSMDGHGTDIQNFKDICDLLCSLQIIDFLIRSITFWIFNITDIQKSVYTTVYPIWYVYPKSAIGKREIYS